jgi:hypothetical protein
METMESHALLIEALRKADAELRGAGKVNPERGAENTINIMRGAQSEIQVVGINALRPAHEGIEPVSRVVRGGGMACFTTMDPSMDMFAKREAHEKTAYGRLRTEWEAAMCDLTDAFQRAGGNGNLNVYMHNKWPALSLVAADPRERGAVMQLNLYPPEEGIRGLSGKTYILNAETDVSAEGDAFKGAIEMLYALQDDSNLVIADNLGKYIAESKTAWLKEFGE